MSTLPSFDKLWDYSDPAATELKFREIMNSNNTLSDMSYHLQLLTQIARTYSLRRLFTESQNILDEIKPALDEKNGLEHLRYHLEQGRVYNSSGDKESARKEFEKALALSDEVANDFHTVDTMHMLAIVSKPDEAIEWNKKAMQKAESSSDERAKNWLGSLYNNLGWDHFAKKDFKTAHDILKKGWDWQVSKGRDAQAAIAKWAVARTLRAMGKVDEALKMQRELEEDNKGKDGFVYEEIAECLYELKKKDEAKPYFAKAHEGLKGDPYIEDERLKRMLELSK